MSLQIAEVVNRELGEGKFYPLQSTFLNPRKEPKFG
jgi:hypothetical protein